MPDCSIYKPVPRKVKLWTGNRGMGSQGSLIQQIDRSSICLWSEWLFRLKGDRIRSASHIIANAQIPTSQGATVVALAVNWSTEQWQNVARLFFLSHGWLYVCAWAIHDTSWDYGKKACLWNHCFDGKTQPPRITDQYRPHLTSGLKGSAANLMVSGSTPQWQGSREVQALIGQEWFGRKKGIKNTWKDVLMLFLNGVCAINDACKYTMQTNPMLIVRRKGSCPLWKSPGSRSSQVRAHRSFCL